MTDRTIPFLCEDEPTHDRWLDAVREAAPALRIKPFADLTKAQRETADVAILVKPDPANIADLPNLKWVQCLWAGVDGLLSTLGEVPFKIVRLVDPVLADVMAEAVLSWTLYLHREMPFYAEQQRQRLWTPLDYVEPRHTRVSVLGMGELGRAAAKRLKANGFDVMGWSRSDRQSVCEWPTTHGDQGLDAILSRTDILVLLLPLTAQTHGIISADKLAKLPQGAQIINFGRGGLINTNDLISALDAKHLKHAVLDVFETEPLPASDPMWSHPKITVLPHISGPSTYASAAAVAATNVTRYLKTGEVPPAVDQKRGY